MVNPKSIYTMHVEHTRYKRELNFKAPIMNTPSYYIGGTPVAIRMMTLKYIKFTSAIVEARFLSECIAVAIL